MKKYSSTLGCGMKQAPMVLGLSVAIMYACCIFVCEC